MRLHIPANRTDHHQPPATVWNWMLWRLRYWEIRRQAKFACFEISQGQAARGLWNRPAAFPMMGVDWLHYIIVIMFALFGAVCVLSVAISLPGTWVMLGLAVLIELLDGMYLTAAEPVTFGWQVLAVCLGIALFGELLEFIAGALGAKAGGGTRRGMIGAIVGGFVGGIAFTFMLWIPVVGTLVGALLGTFVGAMVGEITAEQAMTMRGSIRPATGATFGRVLGSVAKVGVAMVVWLVLVVAAFV